MTSEQKVKAVHRWAKAKRYTDNGGRSYYLIWSLGPYAINSRRLGEGKTASAAWVAAAKRIAESQP